MEGFFEGCIKSEGPFAHMRSTSAILNGLGKNSLIIAPAQTTNIAYSTIPEHLSTTDEVTWKKKN